MKNKVNKLILGLLVVVLMNTCSKIGSEERQAEISTQTMEEYFEAGYKIGILQGMACQRQNNCNKVQFENNSKVIAREFVKNMNK